MEGIESAQQEVFAYPVESLSRKHGPAGYKNYQSYKPWLRDEFAFRCVYCLSRERWTPDGQNAFSCDHVEPQSAAPERILDYENLVYACCSCNSCRQDLPLPLDPTAGALGAHLKVSETGEVIAEGPEGEKFIGLCQLNRPVLVDFRRRLIRLMDLLDGELSEDDRLAIIDFLRYPDDLPDLSKLQPPGKNSKVDSEKESCFARQALGELTEVY